MFQILKKENNKFLALYNDDKKKKGRDIMQPCVMFFDIDGTLMERSRGVDHIPTGVLQQLQKLRSQGHKIFVSSGRTKAMLNKEILNIDFDGLILANGGYVEIDGQSVFEDRMDYELCQKTVNMLEELHCEYMLETAHSLYIKPQYQQLYQFFAQYQMADMFCRHFQCDDVLKRTIKIEANVLDKDKKRIHDFIQNRFGCVIHHDEHGSENAFEFFSPTISKAIGIQKVLKYYHIPQERTYAFGDGVNDIEMIEYCKVGVAMGNAVTSLKEKADLICRPIEENGLERILQILFPS